MEWDINNKEKDDLKKDQIELLDFFFFFLDFFFKSHNIEIPKKD